MDSPQVINSLKITRGSLLCLLLDNVPGALPSKTYTPCITSYDYDAPLSEAGDPTEKYFAIRQVISKVITQKKKLAKAT